MSEAVTPNRLEELLDKEVNRHQPSVVMHGTTWCTCGDETPFDEWRAHVIANQVAALRAALEADPSLVTELGGKKVWDGRQWTFVLLARDDTEEKK